MNTYTNYNVDVLVCGGGVAGCAAGIQAARNGMRVLLLEKRESLGGLCTNGYITGIAGYVDGICKEWVKRLAANGDAIDRRHLPSIEPEKGKIMLEQMLLQAGCRILYGTHVAETVVEDKKITKVIAYSNAGKLIIKAKVVIDTTGDAIVGMAADVPTEVGAAEFMGLNESTSMGFRLSYVNYKKYKEAADAWGLQRKASNSEGFLPIIQAKQYDALEAGDIPYIISPGSLVYPMAGSKDDTCMDVTMDCTHSHYCHNDNTEDLSRQIVDQHTKVVLFVDFLKKYVPGFENCVLTHLADMNGTREGRRIVGEYVFTAKDICAAQKFEDGIAVFPEPLDSHHPTSDSSCAMRHIHLDQPLEEAVCRESIDDVDLKMHPFVRYGGYEVRQNPRTFAEIPYRSLVAAGVDNLLTAGRCLSADWHAIGAIRIIATSMTTGQAAGNAASVAVKEGILPRDIDGKRIREMQKEQGVWLDKPLEGYFGRNRDMEGETMVGGDMAMIIDKDGHTSFEG